MTTISKTGNEPAALVRWRAAQQGGPTYTYASMRHDHAVLDAVLDALHREQGGIDAYTGERIQLGSRDPQSGHRTGDTFHVEHLLPQTHCKPLLSNGNPNPHAGRDVAYDNMVACRPAPNTPRLPYGAHHKDDWPSPVQWPRFLSPLDPTCEGRLVFKINGEVEPRSAGDGVAKTTIERLKLNDDATLVPFRKEAIARTLQRNSIRASEARKRLASLRNAAGAREPFCFALAQALEKHIARIGHIRQRRNATP